MDSCRSGAVGEMMTACELLKRSWVVSFPQTSAPFDLVATDAKGRSVLIQIKASDTPRNESPNRTPRYCWNTSRRKGEYAQTDFDFWILLAMSHLCWFVIPHDVELPKVSSWMPSDTGCVLEKWRNRFELLEKV